MYNFGLLCVGISQGFTREISSGMSLPSNRPLFPFFEIDGARKKCERQELRKRQSGAVRKFGRSGKSVGEYRWAGRK